MRMPSQTTLCSFIFSLLLTSALIPAPGNVSLAAAGAPAAQMAAQTILKGLRGEGIAGSAELALPTPSATPAATAASTPAVSVSVTGLTSELMAKMLKLIASQGVDREFLAPLANALGIGAAGQAWSSRSITAGDAASGVHGFYISRGNDQDIVATLMVTGKSLYCYRAHRDGTVVAAFIGDVATQKITPRDLPDAQKGFDTEISLWSSMVSKPMTTASN